MLLWQRLLVVNTTVVFSVKSLCNGLVLSALTRLLSSLLLPLGCVQWPHVHHSHTQTKVNDGAGSCGACVSTWIVYWLAKFLPFFHTEVFLVCFCCRIYFITYVNCKETITNTNARCSHSHSRFILISATATAAAFTLGSVRFCFGLAWIGLGFQ